MSFFRDWSSANSFQVRDGRRHVWTRQGVRPGDPAADLLFCMAFLACQLQLLGELRAAGLLAEVTVQGGGLFSDGSVAKQVEITLPTYLDDFVVLSVAADCMALLQNVRRIAEIVWSVVSLS